MPNSDYDFNTTSDNNATSDNDINNQPSATELNCSPETTPTNPENPTNPDLQKFNVEESSENGREAAHLGTETDSSSEWSYESESTDISEGSSGAANDALFVGAEDFDDHANLEEAQQAEVVKDNSEFGVSAKAVAAAMARKSRIKPKSSLREEIANNAADIQSHYASRMFLAKTIGSYLESVGLGRSSAGVPLKSNQALGDMLGARGLNLPRIRIRGQMVYALRFVNSSDEEKAAAQGRLDALTSIERKVMEVA